MGKFLKVADDFILHFSGKFPRVNFYSLHFSGILLYRNMNFIEKNYCLFFAFREISKASHSGYELCGYSINLFIRV